MEQDFWLKTSFDRFSMILLRLCFKEFAVILEYDGNLFHL